MNRAQEMTVSVSDGIECSFKECVIVERDLISDIVVMFVRHFRQEITAQYLDVYNTLSELMLK